MSDLNAIPDFQVDIESMATSMRVMKEAIEQLQGQRPGRGSGAPAAYLQLRSPSEDPKNILKVGDIWISSVTGAMRYWDGRLFQPVSIVP